MTTSPKDMKTVYLCGGIAGLSDTECSDWRETVKEEFSGVYNFLDPMRRDYRGREADSAPEIVDGDLIDIVTADIILVNAIRPSWGTAMELYFAASLNRCVLTMCPDDNPSPWLVRHSDIISKTWDVMFDDLESLL